MTAPPEPLSLDEVKLNNRISASDEDALLSGLIVAAREHVERVTGLLLVPTELTETAAQLGDFIELRSWPIISIDEVRSPLLGVMTALTPDTWTASVKRRPARILPKAVAWGTGSTLASIAGLAPLPVEIDLHAGYATPASVPQSIKQAMHLLVAHFYVNRSAVEAGYQAAAAVVPFGVEQLLAPFVLATL